MYICTYCNSNRVSFLAKDLRKRSMCRLSWSVRPNVGYCLFLLSYFCTTEGNIYICLISFPYLEIPSFSSFYFSKSILYFSRFQVPNIDNIAQTACKYRVDHKCLQNGLATSKFYKRTCQAVALAVNLFLFLIRVGQFHIHSALRDFLLVRI